MPSIWIVILVSLEIVMAGNAIALTLAAFLMSLDRRWFGIYALLVIGTTSVFLVSAFNRFNWSYIMESITCRGIWPFFEFVFIGMFIIAGVWAIYLYSEQRKTDRETYELFISGKSDKRLEQHFSFAGLAKNHKNWAQVWFTISICIFLGGIIYAVFHVGHEAICKHLNWSEIFGGLLPNIFIYSLFFTAWHWSASHFRAHWHNFITNAYRHRALQKLETLQDNSEVGQELKRYSGILLLLLADSAYLESGIGVTVTEKIVKLEESLREFLTITHRSS